VETNPYLGGFSVLSKDDDHKITLKQGTELAHALQTLEVVSGLFFFRRSATGNDVKHFNFEPDLMYEKNISWPRCWHKVHMLSMAR